MRVRLGNCGTFLPRVLTVYVSLNPSLDHCPWTGTGILDRYRQVLPKFISETEAIYAGKIYNLIHKVPEVVQDLPSKHLGHVILLPDIKSGQEVSQEDANKIPQSKTLSAFLASDDRDPLSFEQLAFGHPLYVLYSSGMTGPQSALFSLGRARSDEEEIRGKSRNWNGRHTFPMYNDYLDNAALYACWAGLWLPDDSLRRITILPRCEDHMKFIDKQKYTPVPTKEHYISS
ncbi:hypothetical protein BJY52DRAFT_1318361 [Lactarius psammicola]|nr:hypothetical protein BJY52DRAFT_1318361 [Lactarius psammicola]